MEKLTDPQMPAPEGGAAWTGFLILPVLAMLMIFSGLILHWGQGPIVTAGMVLTLCAAAERLSLRRTPRVSGLEGGWRRGLLHIAAGMAAREREPDQGGPR